MCTEMRCMPAVIRSLMLGCFVPLFWIHQVIYTSNKKYFKELNSYMYVGMIMVKKNRDKQPGTR